MDGVLGSIVLGVGLVIFVSWIIRMYNGLVTLKHNVEEAWSNINVLLKQRYDEIPKIVEVCKQYMSYEEETLSGVIEARNKADQAREVGNLDDLATAETVLKGAVTQLFGLAEDYPELMANNNFMQLMERISTLEDSIADRREFYNEAVNLNNTRRELFPDMIIAQKFGFNAATLLKFDNNELKNVDIKDIFDQ